ncbi:hypothetical protein BV898_11377 [Hypsibius exemplaris]|uniref:Transcription initiation factor IIA subunit 1 n=1 Tax=Hypsibius exemplaris TaxID=2072580 RepID=A0A1W0WGS0_HYPEX|nr:hypothetical protein BV898_11377 [Hypsibius exemplaris]
MSKEGNSTWFKESEMLYNYVIDTVMSDCKEYFLDEGVPEDILLDLKAVWEHHVEQSRVTKNQPSSISHHQQQKAPARNNAGGLTQMDGMDGSGDDEGEEEKGDGDVDASGRKYDRPVNDTEEITSEDDEPGAEDPEGLMDTENIVVCQYDKVLRQKNKFKMQLKSGIMTVNEKDYVFQKCLGEADW